ncbi:MAG: YetF domain-containing protein [Pirellulales bacterium]
MEIVLRAAAMYLFLLLIFRLSGKRTLSEADTFDFLMLLIISETTQQAMIRDDHSFTNAAILIVTLVSLTILLSFVKHWSRRASSALDDEPLVVLAHGKLFDKRCDKLRIDESDILEAARENLGLERLEQIKFAVVERTGSISIIPVENAQKLAQKS